MYRKLLILVILTFSSLLQSQILSASEDRGVSRSQIEAALSRLSQYYAEGNYIELANLFSEDATFNNSSLAEALVGRQAILTMFKEGPAPENILHWQVVDGNRLAIGWREIAMQDGCTNGGTYSGMSTMIFNTDGKIGQYEAVLNVIEVKAAYQQLQCQ